MFSYFFSGLHHQVYCTRSQWTESWLNPPEFHAKVLLSGKFDEAQSRNCALCCHANICLSLIFSLSVGPCIVYFILSCYYHAVFWIMLSIYLPCLFLIRNHPKWQVHVLSCPIIIPSLVGVKHVPCSPYLGWWSQLTTDGMPRFLTHCGVTPTIWAMDHSSSP
jgi:hypothetical protein